MQRIVGVVFVLLGLAILVLGLMVVGRAGGAAALNLRTIAGLATGGLCLLAGIWSIRVLPAPSPGAESAPDSEPMDTCFDELLRLLQAEGHTQSAECLDDVLHKSAWTTGSEMVGELGLCIQKFVEAQPRMSPELAKVLDQCRKEVRKVWP